MDKCKFYNPHMDTIYEYCKCLYRLDGCICGGSLHILLDDDNIDTDDILFCLNECVTHPEEEGSELGVLICKEYLKLSLRERYFLDSMWNGMGYDCINNGDCSSCPRMDGLEESGL